MNYEEAKRQFKHALDHQQTISISKLKKIMVALNISLEPTRDKEIEYLKGEIVKFSKKYQSMKRRARRLTKKLKGRD